VDDIIGSLSSREIDILREVGNVGAGHAATALSRLLNRRILMTVPRAFVIPLREAPDLVGGAETLVVGIYLSVTGDAPGHMLFFAPLESAMALVEVLMGPQEDITEMARSALEEVGNILTSSYLTALSDFTGLLVVPTPPLIAVDMLGAILSTVLVEVGKASDYVLVVETEFQDAGRALSGYMVFIPEGIALTTILRSLGERQ